jgi:hypothetical protein
VSEPTEGPTEGETRFVERAEFRLDDAWRDALSAPQKAAIAALTGPARLPVRAQASSTSR